MKAERATYRPCGEQTEAVFGVATAPESAGQRAIGPSADPHGLIGERFDADAGLQYLNARYYDPKLGMFLQPDWWEVTQAGVGTNRYGYGFGDPVNAADPSGHCIFFCDYDRDKDKSERISDYAKDRYDEAKRRLETPNSGSEDRDLSDRLSLDFWEETYQSEFRKSLRTEEEWRDDNFKEQLAFAFSIGLGARSTIAPGIAREGPKGVVTGRHNANITVRNADGRIITHYREVSGNMTPAERALGYPKSMLSTHTEVRALASVKLKSGDSMTITGMRSPCNSCKGAMNLAARDSGASIRYQWREGGKTLTWVANGGSGPP